MNQVIYGKILAAVFLIGLLVAIYRGWQAGRYASTIYKLGERFAAFAMSMIATLTVILTALTIGLAVKVLFG